MKTKNLFMMDILLLMKLWTSKLFFFPHVNEKIYPSDPF